MRTRVRYNLMYGMRMVPWHNGRSIGPYRRWRRQTHRKSEHKERLFCFARYSVEQDKHEIDVSAPVMPKLPRARRYRNTNARRVQCNPRLKNAKTACDSGGGLWLTDNSSSRINDAGQRLMANLNDSSLDDSIGVESGWKCALEWRGSRFSDQTCKYMG